MAPDAIRSIEAALLHHASRQRGGMAMAARAQQAGKLPIIAFLGASDAAFYRLLLPAFVHRLGELGFVDGRTVILATRFARGSIERATESAAELVRLKVDIIVTHGDAQLLAAKGATAVIPIVFAATGDPVAGGLISYGPDLPSSECCVIRQAFAATHPRWEPYAGKPHVRFCAGGAG